MENQKRKVLILLVLLLLCLTALSLLNDQIEPETQGKNHVKKNSKKMFSDWDSEDPENFDFDENNEISENSTNINVGDPNLNSSLTQAPLLFILDNTKFQIQSKQQILRN